ncbi:AI-2E family transporter [Pseudooceanicola algae]|uniref:Uncharacterized protein n=1 Tax=Pseudooceanicola algae TaxID=1537215 RepID=A0A418SJE6_9RHOB|nr:AI-2E family transporter [Pseudooceanicola algae]QPM91867.1 hypothetical protein PSAL_031290 [Pseudooceanicola algae]
MNHQSAAQDSAEPETARRPAALLRNLHRIEYLLAGLLILFTFWSISLAKVIVLPIVLGLLIALTLAPFVRWLRRLGLPSHIAAILIIVSIGSGMAYGLYMLRLPVQMLIQQAPEIQQELRLKLWSVGQKIERVREASEQMQALTGGEAEAGDDEQTTVVVREGSVLQTALASAAGTGSALVIALLLALFLLSSGDMFQRKLVEAMPDFARKRRALRISRVVERQISRYLAAITVINAGLGISIGVTLHVLGMPYGLFWGVAAFLLNYLPYLGGMLGTVVAGAVALVTFDSFGQAMLVPAAYLFLTSIEGQLITPILVGRHLRLNTAAVFIAVIFWAWLWGVAGALLAVPFLVFLKVVCDHIPALRIIGSFLEGSEDANLRRKISRRRKRARRRRGQSSARTADMGLRGSGEPGGVIAGPSSGGTATGLAGSTPGRAPLPTPAKLP